jgi:hypothetical protein
MQAMLSVRVLPAGMSTDLMQHSNGAALQVIRAQLEGVKAWARGSSGKTQPAEFIAAAPQPFGHVACCTTGFAKACQREASVHGWLQPAALTMLCLQGRCGCGVLFFPAAFHSTSMDCSSREWLLTI